MPRFQTTNFVLSRIGDQYLKAGSIRLMSRQTALGDWLFQQFWIPKTGLYGTRNNRSTDHSAVLDFYQQLCIDQIEERREMPAKVHLLASLLPLVRSNKAQNIFPDASITPPKDCPTTTEFSSDELESLLQASRSERITVCEFFNQNREAVDFPDLDETAFKLYRE